MDDLISRQAVLDLAKFDERDGLGSIIHAFDVERLPSINPQKTGMCKDCKFFEYDSVANVDGIPLIVAHEICSKWGGGCKTREDGFCFLFEAKLSENPTD